jgi:hypothetical protein
MDTARAIREAGTQRLQFAAVDYIGDSVSVLAASDFYLGRSGASTVGELIATGPQCLLIPDPQHRDAASPATLSIVPPRAKLAKPRCRPYNERVAARYHHVRPALAAAGRRARRYLFHAGRQRVAQL